MVETSPPKEMQQEEASLSETKPLQETQPEQLAEIENKEAAETSNPNLIDTTTQKQEVTAAAKEAIEENEPRTIVIGPDTVRIAAARRQKNEGGRSHRRRNSSRSKASRIRYVHSTITVQQQVVEDSDSDDDDDEDEEEYGDEENDFDHNDNDGHLMDALTSVNLEQSFFSWDLLVKYLPKIPEVDVFFQRDVIRHKAFFAEGQNIFRSLPPFLFVTRRDTKEVPKDLSFGKVNTFEEIPHTSELLQVYEDFHHQKFPQKEICLLSMKFFIVSYSPTLIHAIDGFGHGAIMLPVNGNLITKIYREERGETYANCILPLAEIRDLMDQEIRNLGRKD